MRRSLGEHCRPVGTEAGMSRDSAGAQQTAAGKSPLPGEEQTTPEQKKREARVRSALFENSYSERSVQGLQTEVDFFGHAELKN